MIIGRITFMIIVFFSHPMQPKLFQVYIGLPEVPHYDAFLVLESRRSNTSNIHSGLLDAD